MHDSNVYNESTHLLFCDYCNLYFNYYLLLYETTYIISGLPQSKTSYSTEVTSHRLHVSSSTYISATPTVIYRWLTSIMNNHGEVYITKEIIISKNTKRETNQESMTRHLISALSHPTDKFGYSAWWPSRMYFVTFFVTYVKLLITNKLLKSSFQLYFIYEMPKMLESYWVHT